MQLLTILFVFSLQDMHPNTFPVPAYPVNQHPQQAFHQPYYSPPQYPVQQPPRVPSRSVHLLQCPLAGPLMAFLGLAVTPGVFHHVLCVIWAGFSPGEVSPSLHPGRQRVHRALSRLCGDGWGSECCCAGRSAQQVDERPVQIVSLKANCSQICHCADL